MSNATLIKICGLTRVDDALAAADEGADFLGMIFFAGSARCVAVDRARAIADAIRRRFSDDAVRPKLVGVFVNQEIEAMVDVCDTVGLDFLQLHGSESPNIALRTRKPFIKAFRIADQVPSTDEFDCEWVLFDTYSPKVPGGTGETFRWDLLDSWNRRQKFFLAGGINPDNVAAAIEKVRPDAIDVASGVEETPGFKSHEKIRRLFAAVRGA